MAKAKQQKKVKLKLVALDGNAYFLMGAFSNAAKKQGFDKEWIKSVLDDCKSGDYSNLIQVLLRNTEA